MPTASRGSFGGHLAWSVLGDLEDAEQFDEAGEGAWVVAGFGGDLLEPVADRVGVEVELLRGGRDVEVGVGECADRLALGVDARHSLVALHSCGGNAPSLKSSVS
jgi:hypothetical protein